MSKRNWKSWNDKEKYNFPQFLKYDTLAILNIIGQTYHSAFGYDIDEIYDYPDLLSLNISDVYIDHEEVREEESIVQAKFRTFNTTKAKEIAESFLLSHRKIIIRLEPVGQYVWEEKPNKVTHIWFSDKQKLKTPVYWYNYPVIGNRFVGKLSSRKYIKINELFDEIVIDSQVKGSPINLDDVYFASRGLCADDTRTYEAFHVLSDDGSTLMLKVDIDNWST